MKGKLSKRLILLSLSNKGNIHFANLGPPRAETAQKKYNYNMKSVQWLTIF